MGIEKHLQFELSDLELLAKHEKMLSKRSECRCAEVTIPSIPINFTSDTLTKEGDPDEEKKSKTAKRKTKKVSDKSHKAAAKGVQKKLQ